MMNSLNLSNSLPFFIGILGHVFFFNRGEHHLCAARYVQLLVCSLLLAACALHRLDHSFIDASLQSLALGGRVLAGVYTSLVVYRMLLHPLNRFPGPLGHRLSNFSFSSKLAKGDAYKKLRRLHEKYGDFVRIGSSDLSITHPKAVQAIYGAGSQCTKAAWYDLNLPMVSLQTYRDKALHDHRRRVWSKAFTDKALRGYEQRIQQYRNKLFGQFDASDGTPENVTKWFNLYSFDIMGDLAFGAPFNMLETGEDHWAIKFLNEGLMALKWMFPVWFFRIMTAVPGLTQNWWRAIEYCAMRAEQRRQNVPTQPDIMSSLLAPLDGKKPKAPDRELLNGDAQLIVIAGSDTTAVTLTNTMLELCRHPEHIDKLRGEIEPHMDGEEVLNSKICNLEHLNAVIWEVLRLHPPVPSALQRKTPSQGLWVENHFIPGNMTVFCPQYAIGRKEEIYTNADAFVPERWYLYPDMVKDRTAWAAFSSGPYGCIGKPLALLNIRTTVARLLMRYEIKFAYAGNGDSCETGAMEHFNLAPGALDLCFTKRTYFRIVPD